MAFVEFSQYEYNYLGFEGSLGTFVGIGMIALVMCLGQVRPVVLHGKVCLGDQRSS